MSEEQLVNFIRQSRQLKISDKEIAQDLVSAGWPLDEIKKAFVSSRQPKNVLVRIDKLFKEYKMSETLIVQAINGIYNLQIYKGEFVSITGQSGSGKSTLLNLIGLVDSPTSGDIWIEERNAVKMNEREMKKMRLNFIGYVFQFFNLIENYSALENIIFPLRMQGIRHGAAKKRALEILEFLELPGKANFYPPELSGGEQQRIAIGRALAKNPTLILADEPTAHLDSKNAEKVLSLLEEISFRFEKTVILVTHEPTFARRANRIVTLADGCVKSIEDGAPVGSNDYLEGLKTAVSGVNPAT